jgi:hypothetical protein
VRSAFALEMMRVNRRRMLVILPLMIAVHLAHIAVFHVPDAERATLAPRIALWRDGIVTAHAATLAIAAAILAVALRFQAARTSRLFAPFTATTYLVHGAVVAAIDQLSVTSVTPFVAYCLGIAVLVALTPATTVAVYAIALVTFVASMAKAQPADNARLAQLPNGFSIVAVSIALACLLHAGRRRDFAQRALIERQRLALAELNSGLEQRVAAQVSEIVARAEEVNRLNAQLDARVRARSNDLSVALARLARGRRDDGSLQRGALLGDRFEVGEPIGSGGMGDVYAGVDRTTGTPVAIKVMQASSSRQLDAWRRFLREASTTATVTHPAVVRMLHVDVSDDGMLFQVQELVEGTTLQQRLRGGHPWDLGVVARFAAVLCDALASAHAAGIVHRDVKPSNVMLTPASPGMKLLDFGIAKLLGDALLAEEAAGLTQTGAILGTPIFMGPEQLEGTADVTDRADVYAVGVVLFMMMTGKHPFESTTPRAAVVNCLVHDAPDARSIVPNVPEAMAEAVGRCLAKEPHARPTAAELAATLVAMADERGVPPLDQLERAGALHDARMRATAQEETATV